MLNEFFTNHGEVVFVGILLSLVMLLIISTSRRKSRKERPDPPSIYAPIRGMYVCYQCDTIFNTTQCPKCAEDAVIPLVHLTGCITENDGIAAVINKIQGRGTWKFPVLHDRLPFTLAPASRPESPNGGVSEDPETVSVLRAGNYPD